MEFIVDDKVRDLGLKILGVKIIGIDNKTISDEFNIFRQTKIEELLEKYKDYDIKNDKVIEGFYKLHDKVSTPRRKNLPACENLIKLLVKRESLVSINKAVDIYNIVSIESKLCLGAHDIDKISGNVTLKIIDGSENFIPLGYTEAKQLKEGQYSFVDDDNDVLCWLDIKQVDKTALDEKSRNIIYFILGNEETTYKELDEVADKIIEYTTKYCGGIPTKLYEVDSL